MTSKLPSWIRELKIWEVQIYNMRQFYLDYPKFQSVTGKLTWTHYCELMSISDKDRRSFYEKECERSGWSVREMKRQISTSLFERLLLSEGKANKEKVYELATKGQELASPEDIVKDPYVFEFLGIPENKYKFRMKKPPFTEF